jgi:hypothetical protein
MTHHPEIDQNNPVAFLKTAMVPAWAVRQEDVLSYWKQPPV